jgi:hypothetical protein
MRLQHLNKLSQNTAIGTMFRAGGVQPEQTWQRWRTQRMKLRSLK